MNYNIEIDTSSILELGNTIKKEGSNFIAVLDKLLIEVKHLNEYFDTKTGKILKEKLIEILGNDKELINNKYLSYSELLNNIVKTYDAVNEEIKRSMN